MNIPTRLGYFLLGLLVGLILSAPANVRAAASVLIDGKPYLLLEWVEAEKLNTHLQKVQEEIERLTERLKLGGCS